MRSLLVSNLRGYTYATDFLCLLVRSWHRFFDLSNLRGVLRGGIGRGRSQECVRLKFFSYTIMIVLLVVATVFQCPCKIQTLSVSRALSPPEANQGRWFTLLPVQWTPPPARMLVAWQQTSALPWSVETHTAVHTQSVGAPTCLLPVSADSPGVPLSCPYGAGHAI